MTCGASNPVTGQACDWSTHAGSSHSWGAWPGTVTLCGSIRHFDAILAEAGRLTEEGLVVHLPVPVKDGTHRDLLDLVHRRKIDASDAVHVVNVDGYIGTSTAQEAAYAGKQGKPVTYLVHLGESWRINGLSGNEPPTLPGSVPAAARTLTEDTMGNDVETRYALPDDARGIR